MAVLRVPPFLGDVQGHLRIIAERLNAALGGKLDNTGTVTLTHDAGSTAVSDPRVGGDTKITFTPTSAHAATEIGNGTMYVSSVGKQTFTITHANNAQTDRTFDYVIHG